ncbi:MAG: hypothetical protein IPF64_13170 [Flavobacteriales bacterium]|nr:hypothetical protein [Flavobacteriales bacterium]
MGALATERSVLDHHVHLPAPPRIDHVLLVLQILAHGTQHTAVLRFLRFTSEHEMEIDLVDLVVMITQDLLQTIHHCIAALRLGIRTEHFAHAMIQQGAKAGLELLVIIAPPELEEVEVALGLVEMIAIDAIVLTAESDLM